MKPSELAKLAAGLAAGTMTAEWIETNHGHDVLGAVMGLSGGLVAASVISTVLDETGISEVLDDLF